MWPFNSDAVSLEKCQNILENPPDQIGSPERILCKTIQARRKEKNSWGEVGGGGGGVMAGRLLKNVGQLGKEDRSMEIA